MGAATVALLVTTISIVFSAKTISRELDMSEPSQAWVVIHPKTAAISILVNEGLHELLVAFARQRGISLRLISVDTISKGGEAVTRGYHTSLSEADANHLLCDWAAWREQSLG
jgi:hypothetical protein